MAHISSPALRAAALLGLAAITVAILVRPGDLVRGRGPGDDLAEAEAQVKAAQAAVNQAKTATKDARAHRDSVSDRVTQAHRRPRPVRASAWTRPG